MPKIVEYKNEWKNSYLEESILLRKAAKDNFINIHHIGSTSVPDLSSKDKIDIMLVVLDITKLECENFAQVGYTLKGEYNIPMRIFGAKREGKKVNLHIFENGDNSIEQLLTFRDYLINNPIIRKEYEDLKIEISQLPDSDEKNGNIGLLNNYNLRKYDFITRILDLASFNKPIIRFCAHNAEIDYLSRYFKNIDVRSKSLSEKFIILYLGTKIIGFSHIINTPASPKIDKIYLENNDKYLLEFFKKSCNKWISASELLKKFY
jgi:GrpB-like predicted nucleotidyltransferase (UPF0157 family)